MNRLLIYFTLLPIWASILPRYSAQTPPPQPVVHAVLFYSPTCGHCQLVINQTLIPMLEQYGSQLSIIGIDVTNSAGGALFSTALQYFNLESSGVPFLVFGDMYLTGSVDIPQKFPPLVEQYLAQGGVDWPAIPGLSDLLVAAEATQAAQPPRTLQTTPAFTPVGVTPSTAARAPTQTQPTPTLAIQLASLEQSSWEIRFASDPVGNSLALIVLVCMLVSIFGALMVWRAKPAPGPASPPPAQTWRWLIPLLCLVGIGVAGYLTYVETAQVQAVCGPVGDCNTVQQSEYARLFGVLPIGILGIIGYVLILLAWASACFGKDRLAVSARLALLGLAACGVLFSIYLTFLEPFVIGATCAWCLTSAIIMTVLLWLSLVPARTAYRAHQLPDQLYRESI